MEHFLHQNFRDNEANGSEHRLAHLLNYEHPQGPEPLPEGNAQNTKEAPEPKVEKPEDVGSKVKQEKKNFFVWMQEQKQKMQNGKQTAEEAIGGGGGDDSAESSITVGLEGDDKRQEADTSQDEAVDAAASQIEDALPQAPESAESSEEPKTHAERLIQQFEKAGQEYNNAKTDAEREVAGLKMFSIALEFLIRMFNGTLFEPIDKKDEKNQDKNQGSERQSAAQESTASGPASTPKTPESPAQQIARDLERRDPQSSEQIAKSIDEIKAESQEKINKNTESIKKIDLRIDGLQQERKNLDDRLDSTSIQLSELEQDSNSSEADKESLRATITSLKGQITAVDNNITAQLTIKAKLEAENRILQRKVETAGKIKTSIESMLPNLRKIVDTLKTTLKVQDVLIKFENEQIKLVLVAPDENLEKMIVRKADNGLLVVSMEDVQKLPSTSSSDDNAKAAAGGNPTENPAATTDRSFETSGGQNPATAGPEQPSATPINNTPKPSSDIPGSRTTSAFPEGEPPDITQSMFGTPNIDIPDMQPIIPDLPSDQIIADTPLQTEGDTDAIVDVPDEEPISPDDRETSVV